MNIEVKVEQEVAPLYKYSELGEGIFKLAWPTDLQKNFIFIPISKENAPSEVLMVNSNSGYPLSLMLVSDDSVYTTYHYVKIDNIKVTVDFSS